MVNLPVFEELGSLAAPKLINWYEDDVPLSEAVAAAVSVTPELLYRAVTGGDDYEILLCVPEQAFNTLSEEAVRLDLALHRIGTVTAGPEVMFTHQGGDMSFVHGSFQHF